MNEVSVNTSDEILFDNEAKDRLVRFFDVLIEMDFEYERNNIEERSEQL